MVSVFHSGLVTVRNDTGGEIKAGDNLFVDAMEEDDRLALLAMWNGLDTDPSALAGQAIDMVQADIPAAYARDPPWRVKRKPDRGPPLITDSIDVESKEPPHGQVVWRESHQMSAPVLFTMYWHGRRNGKQTVKRVDLRAHDWAPHRFVKPVAASDRKTEDLGDMRNGWFFLDEQLCDQTKPETQLLLDLGEAEFRKRRDEWNAQCYCCVSETLSLPVVLLAVIHSYTLMK